MGSTKVKMPEQRSYASEMSDTLAAQIKLAPDLYAAESQYRPQYAQLDMDVAKSILPQMLSLYEGEINPVLSRMEQQAAEGKREGDISAIEKYGQRTRSALDSIDPDGAALRDELNRQAQEELALGGQLTPFQKRALRQSVRSGSSARGFGFGYNDQALETLAEMNAMEDRRRERQAFAQNQMMMNKQVAGDPYMQILGRPSQVNPMMAGAALGQARGYSPGQMFNPESQYAGDLYNQAYQGQLSRNVANANNAAAMKGGMMSMFGNILGG